LSNNVVTIFVGWTRPSYGMGLLVISSQSGNDD